MKSKIAWIGMLLFFMYSSQLVSAKATIKAGPINRDKAITPYHQILVPDGHQVKLGHFPMSSIVSPDEHYLIVSNNGIGTQSLQVINLKTQQVIQTINYQTPEALFFGLVFSSDGKMVYASAGGNNKIRRYSFSDGKLKEKSPIVMASSEKSHFYPSGIVVSSDNRFLYVANNLDNSVSKINLQTKSLVKTVNVGKNPLQLVLDNKGMLFVTNWGENTVSVLDPKTLSLIKTITVGLHPNAIVKGSKSDNLYVANSDSDTISVINTDSNSVTQTIFLHSSKVPTGSQPDALAVNSREQKLYVANAGENCIQEIDISDPKRSPIVKIPTGWYPTDIHLIKHYFLVLNGKGLGAGSNKHGQFISNIMGGTLSIIDRQTKREFDNHTFEKTFYPSRIFNENPYLSQHIPLMLFMKNMSPIKHIFYVIKENRTYDQIFGDLPRGNGDPELTTFGERITPNLHQLAQRFSILDNFYADAEVSPQGHNWSMAAKANDYVEKNWMAVYSGRNREYDFEGENEATYPKAGFLWNNARQSRISFRIYGEFMTFNQGQKVWQPKDLSIGNHYDPKYPGFNLNISDIDRIKEWEKEFSLFVKNKNLPQLEIIRLPNDHTYGTTPGKLTPESMVAQNDAAVGKLVEEISHSPYWKNSAIFIVEDDAQNGWDHVDAHRTAALVISPFTQMHAVDSTFYDTASMLKTIEMILGMPPMTQYDARAFPMFHTFTTNPNFTPYHAVKSNYPLDLINKKNAPGATASQHMNFSIADSIDEEELNHILWKAIKHQESYPSHPNGHTK